ncbi:helix-turn-helix domain-containing protein [Nocardia nova]
MREVGEIIKARRLDLGLTGKGLAARVGTTEVQISRWENEKQQPNPPFLRSIARALNLTADELLGMVEFEVDLSGAWFAAWDTTRGGAAVIDKHTLKATHRGAHFTFAADGDYLWTGNLRFGEGSLTGSYLSTEADRLFEGALYFTLSPDAKAAIGKWSGKWADGLVGGGWGVLARDERRGDWLIRKVIADGPLSEWPADDPWLQERADTARAEMMEEAGR